MSQREKARSLLANNGYRAVGATGNKHKPTDGRMIGHGPFEHDNLDPETGLKRGGRVRAHKPRAPKVPKLAPAARLKGPPPGAMDPDMLAAPPDAAMAPPDAAPAGLAAAAPQGFAPVTGPMAGPPAQLPPDDQPPMRRGGRVRG